MLKTEVLVTETSSPSLRFILKNSLIFVILSIQTTKKNRNYSTSAQQQVLDSLKTLFHISKQLDIVNTNFNLLANNQTTR